MSINTEDLSGLANDWVAAELGGDTASLEEIPADDFVGVGPHGFSLTREQWIARHEAENLKYGSFGLDEAEVRTYGDAAIVVCRRRLRGSTRTRTAATTSTRGSARRSSSSGNAGTGAWPAYSSAPSSAGCKPAARTPQRKEIPCKTKR
jgi:hypothetical protein